MESESEFLVVISKEMRTKLYSQQKVAYSSKRRSRVW